MFQIEGGGNRLGLYANNAHIPPILANDEVEESNISAISSGQGKRLRVEKYAAVPPLRLSRYFQDSRLRGYSFCTPNKMHQHHLDRLPQGGKDVFCEKPAARTYDEAKKMQEAQHESGKVLISRVNRFNAGGTSFAA